MCGILCCLSPTDEKLNSFSDRLEKIKHRGPDETVIKIAQSPNLTTFTCGFNRLAISDVLNGSQPLETDDWIQVHNGEFYEDHNRMWPGLDPYYHQYDEERKESMGYNINYSSDSNHLKKMTVDNAMELSSVLDGIFAHCSYNKKTETLYVARDRFGVIPLYYVVETETLATANDNQTYERIWFASEAKALIGLGEIYMFPPNTVMKVSVRNTDTSSAFHIHKTTQALHPPFPTSDYVDIHDVNGDAPLDDGWTSTDTLMKKLIKAVDRRKQDEVPWGSALSGGLDSTIVSTLLTGRSAHFSAKNAVTTFSIGLKNSTELNVAKEIAAPLGRHHTIVVTVEEALEVIPDVIWALETYDVTTIRAGVMNYLLAKNMKKFGLKVAYSGEGSDELFGGYLYFHHCPSPEEMQLELKRKLNELCYYDCLRCNKAFAAWGIECRVPFLDKEFVDYVMKINPIHKLSSTHPDKKRPEKYILRKNFRWFLDSINDYDNLDVAFPKEELYCDRQKDQFSDSVGKEWIEGLIQEAEIFVTDTELEEAEKLYPFQTPKTKEAYRYRKIFEDLFLCSGEHFVKYDNNTVACSTSVGAEWCKDIQKDPTANYVKESINK